MTDGGRQGWTVVGGAFLGAALGATVLVPYSFGYLIAPLAADRADETAASSPCEVVLLSVVSVRGASGEVCASAASGASTSSSATNSAFRRETGRPEITLPLRRRG